MELPIGSRKNAPFSLIQLEKLYRSGTFTDFTLVLRNSEGYQAEMKVHKVILAASSEYFHRLFLSSMKESIENKLILDEDPRLFRILIEACYGQTQPINSFDDQIALLKLIKFYRFYVPMDRLRRCIEEIELPAIRFGDYLEMVEFVFDGILPDTMIEILVKKVEPDTELIDLPDKTLHLLFSSKYFPGSGFPNEMEVYNLIHRLVLFEHSSELYQYVKFENMTQEERDSLKVEPTIMEKTSRFPLTYNLVKYLNENSTQLQPITVVVSKIIRLVSELSFGGYVSGDGDQTKVRAIFSQKGTLNEGDIIEITEYDLLHNKKSAPPLYIYVTGWRVL